MVDSINTNGSALSALRALNSTRSANATTQNQISTGLEVSSPQDNASTFAIAQQLLGEQSGRSAVQQSVNRAQSTTDVALAAGSQVNDLLLRARELTVAARDPGLDDTSRQALNTEFQQIRDQISTVVDSANFNGTNALQAGGGDVSAITNEDGSESFAVANQDFSLGGGTVTLDPNADISTLAGADAAFAQVEASATNVTSSLSTLGAASNRLQAVEDFNQVLSDTVEVGIGNLVDADLAEAAANQVAGQVQEQLGTTALNIANRQSQSVLTLFEQS